MWPTAGLNASDSSTQTTTYEQTEGNNDALPNASRQQREDWRSTCHWQAWPWPDCAAEWRPGFRHIGGPTACLSAPGAASGAPLLGGAVEGQGRRADQDDFASPAQAGNRRGGLQHLSAEIGGCVY